MSGTSSARGWAGWIAAAALVAIGAWAGAQVGGDWQARRQYADYPELLAADARLGRRVSEWLEASAEKREVLPEKPAEMESDPEGAGLALLRVVCDRYGSVKSRFEAVGLPWKDEQEEREAVWIRDHPSAACDAVLVRIVRDRGVGRPIRQRAGIALLRPGCAAGRDAVADYVCDDALNLIGGDALLLRSPRLELSPTPRMRDLVESPWQDEAPDVAAALLFAGDAEAPSLVVDGLEDAARLKLRARGSNCAEALARLVTDDASLRSRLERAAESFRHPGDDESDDERRESFLRLAADVRAWLAARPLLLETESERARRDYESSARRRLEIATPAAVDVTSGEFDLAAALVRGRDTEHWGEPLPRLDRAARLVRRDAGPDPTPARWIEAMNARLLSYAARSGVSHLSELGMVTWFGDGNCMGLSSLYLAVAERLDLPVHGVKSPQHVFVRWDDGTFRRNIECTEGGIEHHDRWYETRGDGLRIDRADVASGAYLANLTKREFLALALVNRAESHVRREEYEEAVRAADAAVRLFPRSGTALTFRALAHAASGEARREDVCADLAKARAMCRPEAVVARAAADACMRVGAYDEAATWAGDGIALLPDDAGFRTMRARALLRVGRFGDAESDIEAIEASSPEAPASRVLRIEVALVRGGDWFPMIARSFPSAQDREEACLELAEVLLDECPARAASPSDARRVLDAAASVEGYALSTAEFERSSGDSERLLAFVLRHMSRGADRLRYFELLARCCRAEGDEAGAAAAERAANED